MSPPKSKRKNRWSSGENAMNAMFKASDKKFWQSDEDGDDEAVIETIYKMHRRKKTYKHRDRISKIDQLFNSMVARPVGKAEIESQPKARPALLDEFNNLIKKGVFSLGKQRSWDEVAADAKRRGIIAHVG